MVEEISKRVFLPKKRGGGVLDGMWFWACLCYSGIYLFVKEDTISLDGGDDFWVDGDRVSDGACREGVFGGFAVARVVFA